MEFGEKMEIIISNNRDKPIYEQITDQIKEMIINGELSHGERIPSIRALAKQLKVSIITVQRAYEDLQRDGFIETEIGRGTFVLEPNMELLREENLKKIETHLQEAVYLAKSSRLEYESLLKILEIIYLED